MTFTGTDTPFNERGNTPVLYAVVRRANGVACQPTFGQDQQVAGTDNASVVYNQYTRPNPVSDGSFTYPVTFTPVAGSYLVCAWLETDGSDEKGKGDVASEVVTASATTNYVSVNTDTLGVSLSTSSPATGVPFTMTFTGTDTPFNERGNTPVLYAVVRRANGVACQPTFGQDQQVAGTDNASVVYNQYTRPNPVSDGSFTYPVTFTPVAGSYLVCAWLETDGSDEKGKGDVASEVVTASASASYLSQKPKPACVVPKYQGTTLRGHD